MKKFTYIFILFSCLFSSCGDGFLDTYPHDAISSDVAISDMATLKMAVNGLYDLMQVSGYYNQAAFYYGDLKGDDLQSRVETTRDSYYCYIFDHTSENLHAGDLWLRPYRIIRNACSILEAVEKGKVTDGDEVELNDFVGQALAVRALCHFDLVRYFGYPYSKDKGASWGVPLVDHVLGTNEYPIRSTVAQTYEFVIQDLEDAITLLSDAKNDGRINRYAARGILAKVYLYCEEDEKAFITARDLIEDVKSTGQYKLYSNSEYVGSWSLTSKFGTESLFEIANSIDDNTAQNSWGYLIHPEGYNEVIATVDFVNLLNSDPQDIRNNLLLRKVQNNVEMHWLMKYPGPNASTAAQYNNYVVLRLSDVYLLAAEAGLKAGSQYTTAALGYLNDIVSRANPAKSVSNSEFNLDRVLEERRKELIGEGERYFDLLRNGLTVRRAGGLHLYNAPTDINWDYQKCILPIPILLFRMNPDLQQNPGYARD